MLPLADNKKEKNIHLRLAVYPVEKAGSKGCILIMSQL